MIIFSTSEPKTQQKHFSSMEGDCGHRGTSSSVEEVRSQKAVTHHSRSAHWLHSLRIFKGGKSNLAPARASCLLSSGLHPKPPFKGDLHMQNEQWLRAITVCILLLRPCTTLKSACETGSGKGRISLLPNVLASVLFQPPSKSFTFHARSVLVTTDKKEVTQGLEGGAAGRFPPPTPRSFAHPGSCSFEKTKASSRERRRRGHIPGT